MTALGRGEPLSVATASGKPATLVVSGIPDRVALRRWLGTMRAQLRAALRVHGHLLIRGLPLEEARDLALCRDVLSDAPGPAGREETTPRSDFGSGVFSATDLPAPQRIRLHNEDSYSLVVPGLLLFCCLVAPDGGGATTVGDVRCVLRLLPEDLAGSLRRLGWMIERNYHDHVGISWKQAFATDDPAEVERYCAENALDWRWLPGGRLRTRAVRSATLRHPVTGEEAWFNHVAVFSEWTHEPELRDMLRAAWGDDGLPQNTYYGDGTPLGQAEVELLNRAYDEVTVAVRWQAGDLLLVDNLLCAHGREPFSGQRRVAVAMADAVDVRSCAPSGPIGPGSGTRRNDG